MSTFTDSDGVLYEWTDPLLVSTPITITYPGQPPSPPATFGSLANLSQGALWAQFRAAGFRVDPPPDPPALTSPVESVDGAPPQVVVNPTDLTAAGANWRNQIRIPRGNGTLSGRWLDTPAAAMDELWHLAPDYTTRQMVEDLTQQTQGWPTPPLSSDVRRARMMLENLRQYRPVESSVHGDEYDRGISTPQWEARLDAAIKDLTDMEWVDWTLFDEGTDLTSNDRSGVLHAPPPVETKQYGMDSPVSKRASRVLNQWVQTPDGSSTTVAQRNSLEPAIAEYGERPPVLYHGESIPGVTPDHFPVGAPIGFGPIAGFTDSEVARPTGEGTPVLFVLHDSPKGLRVTDRADERSPRTVVGDEWITNGRYTVQGSWVDEDGVLNVELRSAAPADALVASTAPVW